MEEQRLIIQQLRSGLDDLIRKARSAKSQIRLNRLDNKELVKISNTFADEFENLLSFMFDECDLESRYDNYNRFFNKNYDVMEAHKGSLMFYEEETRGGGELTNIKSYFNYLMDYLITVNHFVMSMEFQEIYNECLVPIE